MLLFVTPVKTHLNVITRTYLDLVVVLFDIFLFSSVL